MNERSERPAPPPAPRPGTSFGPYVLVDRLAVGGMAEIFRAKKSAEVGEERTVVVKRMLPHIAAESSGTAMFDEEARLASHVQHPNVVEFLDSGVAENQPYLALEYVPGCDLWQLTRWLTRLGSLLEIPLAMFVVRQLLAGLQAVHDARGEDGELLHIVHHDVSPSNVLLSVHGDVKLGDFGIARTRMATRLGSLSSRAKGKLGYMAPELVTGGRADQKSDIFAAGVIAAELLMGRPLFAGGSELAILLAIRDGNIRPLLDLDLPDPLLGALQEALARDPAKRTPSCAILSEQLGTFCPGPESAYRAELAGLVQRAAPMGLSERPTPKAGIPIAELAKLWNDEATPNVELMPATGDLPTEQYRIKTTSGEQAGPMSYAQLAAKLTSGKYGPDDTVSVGGRPFLPLRDQPRLLRHLPLSTQTPLTTDAQAASEPHIRRNMAAGGIVRALAETAISEDTGLWLCHHGGVRKEVYVANGTPEFVSSNLAGEMLGEFLVSRGVIARGELDMALAVLPRFDGRLGDTLVGLGLVEPLHLFRHIATQVRERVLDLFSWEAGTAEFYRGVPPPPSGFPLGLDVWDIVDAGVAIRFGESDEEQKLRARLKTSLQVVPQLPLSVREGKLPIWLSELIHACEAPRSILDLMLALTAGEDRLLRYVYVALQLDLIRWADS